LDRLEDDDALTALADTLETLSDHAVTSTLVLVGVARSIGELVYRFADPILQPYVVLNGLAEGLITDEQLRQFQNRDHDTDITPGQFETTKQQPLF
jgi:hypothetical protein